MNTLMIAAALLAALPCENGGTCPAPTAVASGFLPSGRMALGANYWASHAATQMWTKWNEAEVVKDLDAMKEAGFTVLRVFPNWADFQPIHAIYLSGGACTVVNDTRMYDSEEPCPDTPCGFAGVDERLVERFERFCDLADERGFKLIVPLLTGQMTFRNFIPPALANRDLCSDPYALMWEGRYLECMVTRLKAKKAIAAWESGNEARILGNACNRFVSEWWQRYVHDTIRRADPSRPVIGVDGLCPASRSSWPTEVNARLSDYVTTHPYAMWGKPYFEDFNGIRNAYFCAALTGALEDLGGRPAFVEEHGARRQEQTSQAGVAADLRGMLWNCWDADTKAMLWWCAFDQTGMTIAPYDWKEPCVELGIFRRDRTPYPGLAAMRKFAALQARLPFAALPKAKKDAVFIVSDEEIVHSSYILAKQAGITPDYQSAEQPIREAKCYFLPNAKGRASLTVRNWEALKAKVRAGATLYLSWNDTFLDDMEAVGGVEVAYRDKSKTVLRPTTAAVSSSGAACAGAEILERDAAGNGVFFRNRCGKGLVYVLAYPMERRLYDGVGGYASNAYRRYETVCPKNWRVIRTGERDVIATEHCFGGGRCGVVVVNNGAADYSAAPTIVKGWHVVDALTDDAEAAKWEGGVLSLKRNAGILIRCAKDGVEW